MKKKKPKTKAFKDTIQKVTNVSPRQTVLLSWLIMNPKTETNLCRLYHVYEHQEKLTNFTSPDIKAGEIVVATYCTLFTSGCSDKLLLASAIRQSCCQVPLFSVRDTSCDTSCNRMPFCFRKTVACTCITASFNSCSHPECCGQINAKW